MGLGRELEKAGVEKAIADKLIGDLKKVTSTAELSNLELAEADRVMLEYSIKLTLHPKAMDASEVLSLRKVGFEDRAIHDICAIVSYFAFVNRIANGLGVELESEAGN